ncbi:DUF4422 domain-containing protein [Campylobacter jejuni]|nr:DUF4422 domain-containing protein [Campylobacter jejuni]
MKEKKENQNPSIKILVGYHKPAELLKDDILTPIHLGRALATEASKDGEMSKEDFQWMCENMIGDDTGDNISHLNRYLNELTGIYWAWKNYDKLGNPDYIGYAHYRRYFIFKEGIQLAPKIWGKYASTYPFIDENFKDIINPRYCNNLSLYDAIIPELFYFKNLGFKNLEESYLSYMNTNRSLILLKDILIKNVKYNRYVEYLLEKSYYYPCNMFVMKRELFFEYCDFIFNVSFQIYKELKDELDAKIYSYHHQRELAWVTEFATGIFIERLSDNKSCKELPIAFLENTNIAPILKPKGQGQINICFSCDDNYSPYLLVAIYSIIQNSSTNNCYSIYILENNISFENKNKILSLKCHNVDIIFINIKNILSQIDKELLYKRDHFTIEAWFRIFIPRIFKNFDKILYLDCDLLILNDIAKLYNMQMQKPLAASIDIVMKILNTNPAFCKNYLENTLKLKKPDGYFQSGVLLFDISKCLEFDMEKKCLSILQNKIFKYVDQDVLNIVFEDNVEYIDSSWNVEWDISDHFLQQDLSVKWLKIYKNNTNNPKIIHYCGSQKPWAYPDKKSSYIWWQYARKTNVYEEIIYRNLNKYNVINTVNAVSIIKNHLSFKIGEILLDTKTFFKIIVFPFRILKTIVQHKLQQILYKSMQNLNSNLKLPPIENCHDYHKAIKIRNYLTYRLGNAFVKHPFTFVFRIRKIYIEWRKFK